MLERLAQFKELVKSAVVDPRPQEGAGAMKQLNVKKLVLLNLPYILLGLFATNLGEAWRLAVGEDASAKMLSFFSTLPVALGSWWPSLHPLDLAVGLCCGAALRLAVVPERQKRQEIPPQHGVRFGQMGHPRRYCPLHGPGVPE